ncbi:MAG: flagellar assembly protein FliW [Desulfobulbaceae bacterium]|nr:flagellar assembly protein FliW [Desulfobulbaceae bacterium]
MTKDEAVSTLKIDTDKIITFPYGIPGFEKYTTYVVYHKEENGLGAYWLESCDKPEVTFTIVDPAQYGLSYDMELTDEELKILQVGNPNDLGIFMMLSKKEGEGKVAVLSANIAGPVIINTAQRLGYQKLIYQPDFSAVVAQKS